jgi:hypothetical protein
MKRMMKKRKKRKRERTRRGMACRAEDREDGAEAVVPEPAAGIGIGGEVVAEDDASVAVVAADAAAAERRRGQRWPLSRPPRGFCSCGDGHACAARGPRTAPPSPSSCTAYTAGSWCRQKERG